jgi:hypothetical protein
LKLPFYALLPLISNIHKRPVVDDPPAARCAFSSRLTIARRRHHCHLRAPFSRGRRYRLHTSKRVPHFWHWSLVARSAPRFYLINLTNSPQAVIVPLSRNILGSILPTWCKEKGDTISIATRDCVLFKMTTAVASATAAPIPQLDRGISPRTYPTLAPSTSGPSIEHSQMSSTSGLQGGVSPSEQNAQKTPTDGRRSPKS